jgi:hypothetical protein
MYETNYMLVVAYFKVLSRRLSGETKGSDKNPFADLSQVPFKYKSITVQDYQ